MPANNDGKQNGYRVRPDLQTKIFAGVALGLTLGVLGWVGKTVQDLDSRMLRIESVFDERARSVDQRLNRIERLLEQTLHKVVEDR